MPIAITKDQEMAAWWKSQIEQCDKENNKWHKRGEKIARHYRDDRDDNTVGVARRLNLFWSNVETLKPAIYSRVPVPICERRFLDKDPVGRVASQILERNLRYEVQMSGYDCAVRRARDDYLLQGRGQVWIRYYPLFGEPISPEQKGPDDILVNGEPKPNDTKPDEQAERELLTENICVDYVHWQDYYTFPPTARTEDEIEGKGRRLFMSRSDLIENFGEKIGKKIELDHKADDEKKTRATSASTVTGQDGMQATVYEIWWKPERCVYFVAKSYDQICKEADDPLKLEGFFPCPAPIVGTMTNDTLIPVPDYVESQDQYNQIDDLSKRIDILTAACKVVGVYDAGAQSLKRVFEEASEPNLIPVDSWAAFAEKGGLKGAIDWVPIEQIAKTLKILIEVRQQIVADLDRMTGISDIMRGTSDARETMGAQRLKTNNTSNRLQERQDAMARFCRDIIAIMGEIISEHYRPETLIQVSGALNDEGMDPPALPPNPMMGHNGGPPMGAPSSPIGAPQGPPSPPMGAAPPPQAPIAVPDEPPAMKQQRKLKMIMEAIGLLKQDKVRGFRIDIETDSTVQGDREQEKEQRTEFVGQVTKFIEVAAQTSQLVPEFAPLAAKMLQFAVRGFRVGRDLESAIEDFADKAEMDAKAKALQPPQPTPEMIDAQAKAKLADHKIQTEGQAAQIEMMKAQAEVKAQEVEAQSEAHNAELERQRKQMEMEWEAKLKQADMKMKEMDIFIAQIKAGVAETEARKKINELGGMMHSDMDDIKGHIDKSHDQIRDHIERSHGNIADHVRMLHDHMNSPAEIRRGPDGRAMSVIKGGIEKKIIRGPDGKAIMLQ